MNPAAMFVSHKLSPAKKVFQKPNILRRKPKVPLIRANPCKPSAAPPAADPLARHKLAEPGPTQAEEGPQAIRRVTAELAKDVAETPSPHATDFENMSRVLDVNTFKEESVLVDDAALDSEQEQVDVEAFLNGAQSTQYKGQYEVHTRLENNYLQKWHIDFENAADRIIMEPSYRVRAADSGAAERVARPAPWPADRDSVAATADRHAAAVTADRHAAAATATAPASFKCPEPLCDEAFASSAQLRRHRGAHGRAVACPARACGREFRARAPLAAHLRADHAPDDAPHGCGECGRRFFWAVGLRAHARAHGPRGAPHSCAWPGCGRAFRQPCRLREHARAHSGARPYRCAHPGCAWAFRTASKLLRHARRHTGERRHRCACGRAFRRREHLRDHQARRRRRALSAPECGALLSEAAESAAAAACAGLAGAGPAGDAGAGPAGAAGAGPAGGAGAGPAGDAGAGPDARAARTHCTWPLAHHAPDPAVEERACAVRSDLFLAAAGGDDSQQMMAGVAPGAGAGAEPASPPPLGLLDLIQEELLYTDAVDESSFQVLLLSGGAELA